MEHRLHHNEELLRKISVSGVKSLSLDRIFTVVLKDGLKPPERAPLIPFCDLPGSLQTLARYPQKSCQAPDSSISLQINEIRVAYQFHPTAKMEYEDKSESPG